MFFKSTDVDSAINDNLAFKIFSKNLDMFSFTDFVKKANLIHNNFYSYELSECISHKSIVKVVCPIHGIFNQKVTYHLKGCGCPKCSSNYCNVDDLIALVKSTRSELTIDFVSVKNRKSTVTVTCHKHGEYKTSIRRLLSGSKCLKCHSDNRMTSIDVYIANANELGYELLTKTIKSNKQAIKLKCPIHGEYNTTASSLLEKRKCFKCTSESSKYTNDEFLKLSGAIHGDKYNYKSNYSHSQIKIKIYCKNCDKDFLQSPANHLQGCGCPYCHCSSGQYELYEYVVNKGFNAELNNRCKLNGKELDIFVEERNLGIEYHGNRWHSTNYVDKHYHFNKYIESRNENIKLLQFFDFEWSDKKRVVQSIINHHLNLSNKIQARKCEIVKLSNIQAASFFNNNHIQGHRSAEYIIGLKFNDDIVSAISFSKHHKYQFEIIRHANLSFNTVTGGLSKLFKKFLHDNSPKTVLSYADLRYSTTSAYDSIGFSFDGYTPPGYFYCKSNRVYSRQQFQKHKLKDKLPNFDDKMSEHENMRNNGYMKIFNAGNARMIWKSF